MGKYRSNESLYAAYAKRYGQIGQEEFFRTVAELDLHPPFDEYDLADVRSHLNPEPAGAAPGVSGGSTEEIGPRDLVGPSGIWFRASEYSLEALQSHPPDDPRILMQSIKPTCRSSIARYCLEDIVEKKPHKAFLKLFADAEEAAHFAEGPPRISEKRHRKLALGVLNFVCEFGLLGIPRRPWEQFKFDLKGATPLTDEDEIQYVSLGKPITLYTVGGSPEKEQEQRMSATGGWPESLQTLPPDPLLRAYGETVNGWVLSFSNFKRLMAAISAADRDPQSAAEAENILNMNLRHVAYGITWDGQNGFVPAWRPGSLHELLYLLVYRDLLYKKAIIECKKCGLIFFQDGRRRKFCDEKCQKAFYAAKRREREREMSQGPAQG